ncbi:MAG TPA: transcription-repair coupling factor, partial [Clostridiales bacterium]|nr:transcription-repair coupling factor [Clostridiales bacterium]
NFNARQLSPWNGSFKQLLEDIGDKKSLAKERLLIFAGNEKSALNLSRDLGDAGIENTYYSDLPDNIPLGSVYLFAGSLSAGFEYPLAAFRLISYNTGRAVSKKSSLSPDRKKGAFFSSLEELVKGSYVVHSGHGIGIYEGIVTLEANGTVKDYIKIKYDKGDILYVPVTQLDQVTKYIGPKSEDAKVKLNRLGGKDWQKTQTRVRAAVRDMADQFIDLYAKRQAIKGYAFSPDIDMQNDFELRFEFQETPDQLRCVHEIKRDMEKPYPMDRLLCGDVGFGKTEVALRAAFKCIADGKQCAVLVPTTILALQHFQTINKRFEGFPVETGMLSRFRTPAQIKKTITGLKRGSVDIVVGTHRLISKDVEFRDLGLIIVDEEQRFGVAQKERLKEMFPAVDVLTLTATPIPRTLNMAMSGIRDMSVLEEAPQDRLPVQTYVIEHDLGVLAQAMAAELRRGGQVYYLHNRVESIAGTALKIRELLPEARVSVAHGQMNEDELSDTWRALLENEIDILVCTTIIETGVDVPNVNTLIIEDADRMGLAQLHQIRGRVGRSSRRASAFFTFKRGKQLTEIATNRLSAIREFTEFGSGFKIAMRDLELRGAGNILGAQQHGHLQSVGYDMYLKLLAQAVNDARGQAPPEAEKECLIDLPINAHIPENYISSLPQKLAMYRRIADIKNKADADDVLDELIDRFGDPPESVTGLINIALIRSLAVKHGIYEIGQRQNALAFFSEDFDIAKINRLAQRMRGRVRVVPGDRAHFIIKTVATESLLDLLKRVFDIFESGVTGESKLDLKNG